MIHLEIKKKTKSHSRLTLLIEYGVNPLGVDP